MDNHDRLPKESDKAWQAFQYYRGMGANRDRKDFLEHIKSGTHHDPSRSIKATASTIQTWSSRFDWAERLQAWDAEIQRQASVEQAEEQKKEQLERLEVFRKVADQGAVANIAAASSLSKVQANLAKKVQIIVEGANVDNLDDLERVSGVLERFNRALNGTAQALNGTFDLKTKIEGLDVVLEMIE